MAWPAAASPANGRPSDASAEDGLAVLLEACERAVEELGTAIPPAQMRALLIIDQAGTLNLSGLASELAATASAASRLCDRMEAAGLVKRGRAASSRREVLLMPTESGRRLAEWVRRRRRSALGTVLESMTQEGREALAQGLRELALDFGARTRR